MFESREWGFSVDGAFGNSRTPWNSPLFQKTIVAQMMKILAPFNEPKDWSPYPEVTTTGPYSESVESVLHTYVVFHSVLLLILFFRLLLVAQIFIFLLHFPNNVSYTFTIVPMCATCPTHLMLLDFTTVIMFGEDYKSWSPALYCFLHSPVTRALGSDIFHRMYSA
jgi:hypothetical protein